MNARVPIGQMMPADVLNPDMTPRRSGEVTREGASKSNSDDYEIAPVDVATARDITRGLGLDDATTATVLRIADSGQPPYRVGVDLGRALLDLGIDRERPGIAREIVQRARRYAMRAWLEDRQPPLSKGGPFIGPRGGKWADPQHTIPWREVWADPRAGADLPVITSESSPIRLDEMEGLEGVVLTFLPGKRNNGWAARHRRNLDLDLAEMRRQGVTQVIDLTEKGEPEHRAGVPDYHARVEAAGMRVVHIPVPDRTVPRPASLKKAIDAIRKERGRGGKTAVHCLGGLGRTGVVAGAMLAEDHPELSGDEIIRRLRAARGPHAPDTAAQEGAIRRRAGK